MPLSTEFIYKTLTPLPSSNTAALQTRMKRLFAEGFSALDIAEPLLSFDAEKEAEEIREFLETRNLKVIGIRVNGIVAGFANLEDLGAGPSGNFRQPFPGDLMLTESTSLPEVISKLDQSSYCCFVSILGEVGAIVTRTDIQKPPVRMWLFGMITIIEMFLTRSIEERFPNDTWKEELSDGRLQKAVDLCQERHRRQQPAKLLDCLQLPDKATILMKDPDMRDDFGFDSKRAGEQSIKLLESLRNNLAHAQDIVSFNWEAIVMISRRLDKIMTRI